MLTAQRLNMTDSNYVYILPYPNKNTVVQPYPWVATPPGSSNISDSVAKNAYLGAMIVRLIVNC